jgi:hypothetical protein
MGRYNVDNMINQSVNLGRIKEVVYEEKSSSPSVRLLSTNYQDPESYLRQPYSGFDSTLPPLSKAQFMDRNIVSES